MITERTPLFEPSAYDISDELLRVAHANHAGVPAVGRTSELEALRTVGRRDASLGRIYEGHLNGAQLVARYGTPEQRHDLAADIEARHVFGVWNTQDADGVRIEAARDGFTLHGAKTWASGAGSITRAIVTGAWPDGTSQMCLVPMDRARVEIDRSQWRPIGMEASESFRVDFAGTSLASKDLLGRPGDYGRQPWFFGGALRFLAVQTGVVERLTAEAAAYIVEQKRESDALQLVRAAEMRVALRTCLHWLRAGATAWTAFDAEESETNAAAVLDIVDMARVAVERAALDVIEAAVRSVGARGLLHPVPIAGLVRDLQMYLRQPAPDAVLMRVGATAFREATSAQSAAIASSTGTMP
jgi:alkylation response protein AidB-like acyl-CoA dehydrogenase